LEDDLFWLMVNKQKRQVVNQSVMVLIFCFQQPISWSRARRQDWPGREAVQVILL